MVQVQQILEYPILFSLDYCSKKLLVKMLNFIHKNVQKRYSLNNLQPKSGGGSDLKNLNFYLDMPLFKK